MCRALPWCVARKWTGVYVIDDSGVPLLRQVRLGPVAGDQVELLSGVDAGERVATDVHAATRAVLDAAAGGR